jgi:hypothetical protein
VEYFYSIVPDPVGECKYKRPPDQIANRDNYTLNCPSLHPLVPHSREPNDGGIGLKRLENCQHFEVSKSLTAFPIKSRALGDRVLDPGGEKEDTIAGKN